MSESIVPVTGITFKRWTSEDEAERHSSITLHIPGSQGDYSYATSSRGTLSSRMPVFSRGDETPQRRFIASAQHTLKMIEDLRSRDALVEKT